MDYCPHRYSPLSSNKCIARIMHTSDTYTARKNSMLQTYVYEQARLYPKSVKYTHIFISESQEQPELIVSSRHKEIKVTGMSKKDDIKKIFSMHLWLNIA